MFATGIGLVILGLQRIEKESVKTEEPQEKEKERAKKPPKGSFFDIIKKFFDEEGVN